MAACRHPAPADHPAPPGLPWRALCSAPSPRRQLQYCYLGFSVTVLLPLSLPIDGTDWASQFATWGAANWALLLLVSSVVCIGARGAGGGWGWPRAQADPGRALSQPHPPMPLTASAPCPPDPLPLHPACPRRRQLLHPALHVAPGRPRGVHALRAAPGGHHRRVKAAAGHHSYYHGPAGTPRPLPWPCCCRRCCCCCALPGAGARGGRGRTWQHAGSGRLACQRGPLLAHRPLPAPGPAPLPQIAGVVITVGAVTFYVWWQWRASRAQDAAPAHSTPANVAHGPAGATPAPTEAARERAGAAKGAPPAADPATGTR